MMRRKARLVVPVEERVTDPDRWHPRLRRRVREWAGVYTYTRRRGWQKVAVVVELRPTPRDAIRHMKEAA